MLFAETEVEEGPSAPPAADRPRRLALSLAEVMALVGGLLLALVTAAALATGLAGVLARSTVVALVSAGLLAAAGLALLHRRRVRFAARELLLAVLLAALALALTLPGWDYAAGDRDPGVYVAHAVAIAREGRVVIDDQVAAARASIPVERTDAPPVAGPHGRFPGLWPAPGDPDAMKPQFFDGYATLLAVGHQFGGRTGLTLVGPLCAALSVVAIGLAARRAFDPATGALAGVLLATNAMEVWQGRYPTAEMAAQALVAVGLLALVLAVQLRWRPAAGLAGLTAGAAFLVRPDAIALVIGAAAAGAALFALRRFDRRCTWFLVGVLLTLPLGLYQAYGLNEYYTVYNDAPSARVLALLLGGLAVAGLVGRAVVDLVRPRVVVRDPDVWMRRIGTLAAVAFAAFLVLAVVRPALFGEHTRVTATGEVVRSYYEETLPRLAWFLSWWGIIAMAAGVGVLGWRRWRADQMVLVLPPAALLPLFIWSPHISSRLMWWTRRFVPLVLLAMVLLIAIALGAALRAARERGRLSEVLVGGGACALVALTLVPALPLTTHREMDGVWELVEELSDLSGDRQGLYLWEATDGTVYDPARVLGGPLWLIGDELSAVLPAEPTAEDLAAFRATFPGAPVFVVTHGGPPAEVFLEAGAEPVLGGTWTFPWWEESDDHLPTSADALPLQLAVWQVP